MAFDHTGFFTIVGKYVKTINTLDGYLDATETLKQEIRDAFETEDLHDLYASLPALFAGYQSNTTSFIQSLITDMQNLILDRAYTEEELDYYETGVTAVLNALYDLMDVSSISIQSSVVSLGGSDVDNADTYIDSTADQAMGTLLCTRILDGVNSPGNGVTAHLRYLDVESQLARSTTATAEVTVVSSLNAETVQLYPTASETGPYVLEDEEPSLGPTLTNGLSTRTGLSNAGFDTFTVSNQPDNWSVAGGVAGTDWEQTTNTSTYGAGTASGLQVNTAGVTVKQQVTGLVHNTSYMMFALVGTDGGVVSEGNTTDWIINLETNAGTVVKSLGTFSPELIDGSIGATGLFSNLVLAYKQFSLAETVNLSDLYIELECDAFSGGTIVGTLFQVGIVPVTYWNGLGWVYVSPTSQQELGDKGSLVVANNDNGVFQSFFRKAFNVQLPTADSPTISDTLAT